MYRDGFIMQAKGLFRSKLAVCIFCGAYSHSFPLLTFLFLYRALSLTQ